MKVYIKTHGCQMNVYDSQTMAQLLQNGLSASQTEDEEAADVLILNTCSIREKAQDKVFSQLGRWRSLKERNENVIIVVAGCVASQERELLAKRAPFVDCIIGPQAIHKLPALIEQRVGRQAKRVDVEVAFLPIDKFDSLPKPKASGPEAFVTVMEGCSKFCSFCVVPYTRGEEVSRPFEDIKREVVGLVEQGVREITLLGQNVNGYSISYQENGVKRLIDFGLLLRAVAGIPGVKRVRFTTSHPIECNHGLYEAYEEEAKIVSHMHLPVQSGSDAILARMKRQHNRADYLDIISSLRNARSDITISSDFIVGFPGETDADFAATLDLVDQVGFDASYSFIYSARPGTPAAEFADNIPLAVKKQRLAILQKRLAQSASNIANRMVGTEQQILVNGYSKKSLGKLQGRTQNNHIVHFEALDALLIGEIVSVIIDEVQPNSLHGRLLNKATQVA